MQPSESGHSGLAGGGVGKNADVGASRGGVGGSSPRRSAGGGIVNTNGGNLAVVTPYLQPEIIDDSHLGLRSRHHHGGLSVPPSAAAAAATSTAASASASGGVASFATKNILPSDEDSSTNRCVTNAHFEAGENDSFDASYLSSSPDKNYVTPDQSFFPSASSRPIRSTPGSNGSSPSRRALTRPVPSGKTPPRGPATAYTSFLRPRGLQGRVLFAPKSTGGTGMGMVSVDIPSSGSSNGSSPVRQQRPFPVQQLSSSAQQYQHSHHQTRLTSSIFSERGRKRRAYSANGPFSSSLSSTSAGAGSGGAATGASSTSNHLIGQKTPHPMSPGSIGLEAMSIHSPHRNGLQQSNNFINEAAAGTPPPPPPNFSPNNDTDDVTGNTRGHGAADLPPANRTAEAAPSSTSRRGSSNSSRDVLSGATTPTAMFQTPQTSPRRSGSRCPSSALGSMSIGGSSIGGGSCFGPYRSRTPSPNPLMLLGGRCGHRRQGSGTSHISAMSGLSATVGGGGSDSNPFDTSFDTSTGASSVDVDGGERKRKGGEGVGESFTSPSTRSLAQHPQPSPRHVPIMVLTKKKETDENNSADNDSADNQTLSEGPKSLEETPAPYSHKKEEASKDLNRLLDVALPTSTETNAQAHPSLSTPSVPPTGSTSFHPGPSPANSARGFNLSPRRPLPPSMMSPGSTGSRMLERSPMIETPAWALAAAEAEAEVATRATSARGQRAASNNSSPGSFLSPRRTIEDGRLADLLFGEDDPPSPLLSSSHRGFGAASRADTSKPPPFPCNGPIRAHNGDDMGAVMDGLLSGFNRGHGLSGKQRLESSNSLAFSMGSSSNSLDRLKADDGFPIKTLSFGGDQRGGTERHPIGTGPTSERGASHPSPPSSSHTTPRRNGASKIANAGARLPPGFMARSVLTPSKSGGSLQRLLDSHRAKNKGEIELEDDSLSDSCDGSQGPNDMFFLNSPEEVAAATIHAEVENNRAGSAENTDEYAGGRPKKRRSMADIKSSQPPTMSMEISETYRSNQDQSPSEGLLKKALSSSSSSSTLESAKLSARQSGRRNGGSRSASNVPKLKKARSVTFSPSPEVSHSVTSMNRASTAAGQRILSQTSSSSLYGMGIVQEEPAPNSNGATADTADGNEESSNMNAASAVTPHQNTDSTDPYYFAAISSKSRSESGDTLSTPNGSHCNLQGHNKRQSFGSSGSLLAHFNNLNRHESEASLNWGVPTYNGVSRRASSRAESALGLPIADDEDEAPAAATSRPPSTAKAYTPPARDLITPPAQTFSLGIGESANKARGRGRRMLSPPPLPSKWAGNDYEEDAMTFEAPMNSEAPHDHSHEGDKRRKHLCIAAADKDAVKIAIARMEADQSP